MNYNDDDCDYADDSCDIIGEAIIAGALVAFILLVTALH